MDCVPRKCGKCRTETGHKAIIGENIKAVCRECAQQDCVSLGAHYGDLAYPDGRNFKVFSQLQDTDYGPELEVTIVQTSPEFKIVWCSQEAMGIPGQIGMWQRYVHEEQDCG